MIQKICLSILLSLAFTSATSQALSKEEKDNHSNNFSLGFHLNNFQNDFGYGINATSPFILHKRLAFVAGYNMAYRDGTLKSDTFSTWYRYSSLKVGLIGMGGMIGKSIRMYGTGGLLLLMPNSKFSSHSTEIGGYGMWGFEFIFNPRVSYYIELGGVGVGATADKMRGNPIYSNGFASTVGMHFYFGKK